MLYNNINRTHHASDFSCATRWDFLFMGCFMYQYPKQILTIEQQVQSYADAGMEITSREEITQILLKKFTVSIMYSIRMEEFQRAVR